MAKWIRVAAAAVVSLMLVLLFGDVLTAYYRPMEDKAYNLSIGDWEGEAVTELVPDGFGGFSGLSEPGQTFYFSRVIEEDLDSPTLYLDVADRTFAVFLDGTLLYTDCPELDNRVGHLRLPTLEWYRTDPLVVTLPLDCAGKTLTVAQSTPTILDGSGEKVWPCSVKLYCGYAYESALISKSFRAAVPAALAYAAGIALLALFLWQAFQGRLDPGTLCGALAAFSYLSSRIADTGFIHLYFTVDLGHVFQDLTLLMLLVMVLCKLSGWRRALLAAVTALLGGLSLVKIVLMARENISVSVMTDFAWLGIAGLLLAQVLGFWEWNRGRWFFRLFCPLALAGTALYVIPAMICMDPARRAATAFLWLQKGVSLPAAFLSAVVEWGHAEMSRRTEERLLAQRGALAQSSYEAMRRQHEEVMMIRHDMMKHFQLLRRTTSDERTAEYLDELMGQNEKIRPVVQSGNEMLDIILNSKLNAAADAGIAVELVRVQAPAALPLTDTELCSLVMNLLDNALEAAAAPGVERPYIKLDLCVRGHFFLFSCENSTRMEHARREAAPGHGLGLKIIEQIAARYDSLLETERRAGTYIVKLAIPLICPPDGLAAVLSHWRGI